MFTKYEEHGAMIAYVACRVGDIMFTGTVVALAASETALRPFRAGATVRLTPETPIAFTVLLIERALNQSISLPQTQYAQDLRKST